VPLRGFEWSIGKPSGIAGVGAHSQVAAGHCGMVGKMGLGWVVSVRVITERDNRVREAHCVRRGRRNIGEDRAV